VNEKRDDAPASTPAIPADMKAFNRALIEEWRANNGRLSGRMAASKLILLTTIGARSGKPRTTVIGYRRRGAELVAIASNNGAPDDPAWYRNLQAHPTATVELGPDKFEVRTRTARPEEREEYARVIEYLDRQQQLKKSEIPIVILERIET
jgi:deazaflavin-dependent oxidoreductase (nitroreductase family)